MPVRRFGRRGADRPRGSCPEPRPRGRHLPLLRIPARSGRPGSEGIRTLLYQPLRTPRQPLPYLSGRLRTTAQGFAESRCRGDADTPGRGDPCRGRGPCRRRAAALRRPFAARRRGTSRHCRTDVRGLSGGFLHGPRARMPRGVPFDPCAALHPEHVGLQRAPQGAEPCNPHHARRQRPLPRLHGQRHGAKRRQQGGRTRRRQCFPRLGASRTGDRRADDRSLEHRRSRQVRTPAFQPALHHAGCQPPRPRTLLRPVHRRGAL